MTRSLRLFVLSLCALMLSASLPAVAQTPKPSSAAQNAAVERPVAALNSVWLEELTWMEVRDALASGTTTIIIATGGIEQNGPYLALGKHNYVLNQACAAIARKLGDALCAPILKFVPEGDIDEPSGHMRYPGTISMREDTYRAILRDMAMSLEAHGFTRIVFIGDSGGNQKGMEAVAEEMNARWSDARAYFVPEYYQSYFEGFDLLRDRFGVEQPVDEGIHDDIVITTQMMAGDPETVRYRQRLQAGKASINGVSIADLPAARSMGNAVLQHRVERTAAAIEAARKRS
ncbi:MAG: creatininase family protein [Halieaceae bacterium]|jgi:creatinine amidohydrolase/Fe(II)-dependent formamide hydrolase-like protein|nr:creatininase family protein [Halieaceae bacterium]